MKTDEPIARAIRDTFQSPNVCDSNMEPANLVDVVDRLAGAMRLAAHSIFPSDATRGHDATGGTICSLTEAVMGLTAGLCRIADSISELANSVKDKA